MEYLGRNDALTVTALNTYIGDLMQSDEILTHVHVRGEVSNFKRHPSGHLYFSLKDEGGVLKCVMFRSAALKLKFTPQDGMKLLVRGSVGVYSPSGQYQLYVTAMEPDGVGALYIAFENLKKKLAAEGLFDEERKKPLPSFPERIGIVTSPTGAAIQDMLNILARRFPLAKIEIYPALVQGTEAPATLIRGIRYFEHSKPDVIIIGRGGGSAEDLFCFNDEGLAREIFACSVPVISAVGHEVDFTICDFVADLRAPTPSAAAELAVPDDRDVIASLDSMRERAKNALLSVLRLSRLRLAAAASSYVITSPERIIEPCGLRLDAARERLFSSVKDTVGDKRRSLALLSGRCQALSPLAVLGRGYAVISSGGKTVRCVSDAPPGSVITARLSDGTLTATVHPCEKE